MAKIIFSEVDSWEEQILQEGLKDHQLIFVKDPLIETSVIDPNWADAEILCTFIYTQGKKELLDKFPNLKLIVTRSTGFDHLDLNYCKERNITVCNVPKYGVHTVAEHTWSLILALTRRIIPSVEHTRQGNFSLDGLAGVDLFGKTLGVVGVGNIGSVVAQIGLAFGMNVLAHNPSVKEDLQAKGIQFVSFEELLSKSDIITFHVPLTKETTHMLNMTNKQFVKKGSFIVNASRGAVIETEALVELLQQQTVRGAGLDVLEGEYEIHEERQLLSETFLNMCDLRTQLLDHQLLMRDDVIITPHNAFHSEESLREILNTTVSDITGFLSGNVQNKVVAEG